MLLAVDSIIRLAPLGSDDVPPATSKTDDIMCTSVLLAPAQQTCKSVLWISHCD